MGARVVRIEPQRRLAFLDLLGNPARLAQGIAEAAVPFYVGRLDPQ